VATARRVERPLRIELGGRIGAERSDAFTRTLTDFGYDQEMLGVGTNISLGVSRELAVTGLGSARVWVGGLVDHAQAPTWRRSTELEPLEFEWATTSLLATARALQPLGGTRFGVYAQLGAGLAIGRTRFSDAMNETTRETHLGPAISAGAGLSIDSVIFRGLAMSLGYELGYARAIANNFDEVHGSGGHRVGLGLSYSY
jgi:hypothetical protein